MPRQQEQQDETTTTATTASTTTTTEQEEYNAQMQELEAEMELTDYGRNEQGQLTAKITRKQGKIRAIKRKALEKEDVENAKVERRSNPSKRLRGSKIAFEDEVVMGSIIIGEGSKKKDVGGDDEATGEVHGLVDNSDDDNGSIQDGELHKDSDEELVIPPTSADDCREQQQQGNKSSSSKKSTRSKSPTPKGKRTPRQMYRLKNLRSHRLAEKHGDALGSYARGLDSSALREWRR